MPFFKYTPIIAKITSNSACGTSKEYFFAAMMFADEC